MDEIALLLSASETHNRKNVNKSIAQTIDALGEVCRARARGRPSCPRLRLDDVGFCPYGGEVDPARGLEMARRLFELGSYQVEMLG